MAQFPLSSTPPKYSLAPTEYHRTPIEHLWNAQEMLTNTLETHNFMGVTPHGAAIRALRAAHRVSLRALAQTAGLTAGYIHRLETGARGATPDTLRRIAQALGVPINAITREA